MQASSARLPSWCLAEPLCQGQAGPDWLQLIALIASYSTAVDVVKSAGSTCCFLEAGWFFRGAPAACRRPKTASKAAPGTFHERTRKLFVPPSLLPWPKRILVRSFSLWDSRFLSCGFPSDPFHLLLLLLPLSGFFRPFIYTHCASHCKTHRNPCGICCFFLVWVLGGCFVLLYITISSHSLLLRPLIPAIGAATCIDRKHITTLFSWLH